MSGYTRTTTIDVDQDTAYAYLSKAENLPEYFPRITEVTRTTGDEVETTAVIDPPGEAEQKVHGTAWFKADDDARKVEWGSEGSNRYHGELDFDPAGNPPHQCGSPSTPRVATPASRSRSMRRWRRSRTSSRQAPECPA